jgi:hypothetical protein
VDHFKHTFRILLLIAIFTLAWAIKTSPGLAAPGAASLAANVPVSTAFAYPGVLLVNNSPVSGVYDLEFRLFDAATAGAQVGSAQVRENVPIRDGHYLVNLNFGSSPFSGSARWLQVGWRGETSTGTFTTQPPRQLLTGTPYALSVRPGATIAGSIPAGSRYDAALKVTNTSSSNGIGLYGIASATSGTTIGVAGNAHSPGGFGVYGYGSNGAAGIRGEATAGHGVWGSTTGAAGIRGEATTGTGVWGSSTSWRGVYGASQDNAGVVGESTNFDGGYFVSHGIHNAGVSGRNDSGGGFGVYGETLDQTTGGAGVHGSALRSGGVGVLGNAAVGQGVRGITGAGTAGVYGESNGVNASGVEGYANNGASAAGVYGHSANGVGVWGRSEASGGFAMKAEGHAAQTLPGFGWVKFMAFIDPYHTADPIAQCYNSQLPAPQASSGNCGFSVDPNSLACNTTKIIKFGYPIHDRFVVVTPFRNEKGNISANLTPIGTDIGVQTFYSTASTGTYNGSLTCARFYIVVY